MNILKIFLVFFIVALSSCSSSFESPIIDLQQPYVHNLESVNRIDSAVKEFSKKYGFEVRVNKTREEILGVGNGARTFSYWLFLENQKKPGINVLSDGEVYRVMIFESGFSNKQELYFNKENLFEFLQIKDNQEN